MIDNFSGKYFFLSNFYLCNITDDDEIKYPSVEHAFQAQKTDDMKWKRHIASLSHPSLAKRSGRRAPLREDWEDVKVDVMRELVRRKFMQDPHLGKKLVDTGDKELIEGNTWGDVFWGVYKGTGENWLGKILMEVRDEIKFMYRDYIPKKERDNV